MNKLLDKIDNAFRLRKPLDPRWHVIWGIIGIGIMLAFYSYLSWDRRQDNPNDTTLPSIVEIAQATGKVISPQGFEKKRWLIIDSKETFWRLFKGVAIGSVLSVCLGVLMGCYEKIYAFFFMVLSFWKGAPATAMLAIFFAIAGTGESLYTALLVAGILPTLTMAIAISAKKDIPTKKINKSYTLGSSNAEVIREVVWPQTLPKIIDAIRLQIGPAMVYLIAAEYMVAQAGFGYTLRIQGRLLHMDVVYLYIAILALVGLIIDKLMVTLRKKLCPWYEVMK